MEIVEVKKYGNRIERFYRVKWIFCRRKYIEYGRVRRDVVNIY